MPTLCGGAQRDFLVHLLGLEAEGNAPFKIFSRYGFDGTHFLPFSPTTCPCRQRTLTMPSKPDTLGPIIVTTRVTMSMVPNALFPNPSQRTEA